MSGLKALLAKILCCCSIGTAESPASSEESYLGIRTRVRIVRAEHYAPPQCRSHRASPIGSTGDSSSDADNPAGNEVWWESDEWDCDSCIVDSTGRHRHRDPQRIVPFTIIYEEDDEDNGSDESTASTVVLFRLRSNDPITAKGDLIPLLAPYKRVLSSEDVISTLLKVLTSDDTRMRGHDLKRIFEAHDRDNYITPFLSPDFETHLKLLQTTFSLEPDEIQSISCLHGVLIAAKMYERAGKGYLEHAHECYAYAANLHSITGMLGAGRCLDKMDEVGRSEHSRKYLQMAHFEAERRNAIRALSRKAYRQIEQLYR